MTIAPELAGRAEAATALSDLLRAADTGSGGGLVVDGIAGIGKSAVLEVAAKEAAALGFVVRRAVGVPVEADLAFGALMSVFADRRAHRSRAPWRAALDGAIGRRPTPTRNGDATPRQAASWIEVAGDAIDVLSRAGREHPQLVILDDVQWADASSVAVLGHIARHGVADRVAVLLARRSSDTHDGGHHSVLAGVPVLHLPLLTHDASIDALCRLGCSPSDAELWARRCGGLPLAISEVARRRLPLAQRDAIASVLPDIYREQVTALTPVAIDALLALALGDDPRLLPAVGGDAALLALRAAASAGLVELEGDDTAPTARFRHPLVRAAVLAVSNGDEERSMHRRLAEALVDAGDADRAALHLAAAVADVDEDAAAAMNTMAERAMARGALLEGARAFRRAAALSTDPDARSIRLCRAADAFFDHGDATVAFPLVEESLQTARDPRVAADARSLRARMAMWVHSPGETTRELLAIADDMRTVDPGRAASALATASGAGHLDGDIEIAIERGREAERLAAEAQDVVIAAAASGFVASNCGFAGNWEESEARLEPLEPVMRMLLASRSWAGIHLAELLGTSWVCSERWDDAERLVRELVHLARTMGARLKVASTTLLLGSLCWRQGRWDEAYALERPLLEDTNVPPITLAWMRVLVAQVTATMGKVDETRELIGLGLPVAVAADVPLIVAMAHAALGHVELSLGNDELALTHLDRTAVLTERMGFVEPEYFPWLGDHLEALRRAGRNEEAAERAALLAKIGATGGRLWAEGVAERTKAQLASTPDAADAAFERSLAALDRLGMPFEVARTLLARGAPRDLADARRLFLRLGATVWAAACGPVWDGHERRNRSVEAAASQRLLEQLSPAERNVALAVASGRTNREIAAELHLSVKTIDHYLQHAYRRVGVRNRTELASAIARSIAAPTRD